MDEKIIVLFDDYLQGNLDVATKKDLEDRFANEPDVKDAFELFKEINGHLDHTFSEERADFKKQLQTVSDEHFSSKQVINSTPKVIKFNPWKYAVAACVVLLVGGVVFNPFSTPSYGDYAFDGEIHLVERGDDEGAFAKAEIAFNTENYTEAIAQFDQILHNNPDQVEVSYYKGIALVETEQYAKADVVFQKLRSGTSVYKYKAQWYAALSLLKQEKIEACKKLLQGLPETAEDYKRAQKLLKKL